MKNIEMKMDKMDNNNIIERGQPEDNSQNSQD